MRNRDSGSASRAKHNAPSPGHCDDDGVLSTGAASFAATFGKRPAPLSAQQSRGVRSRLHVLLGESLESARRCGVTLTAAQLASVCDELLREAREPGYRPDFGGSVEGFLLSGLFDDLVQQPSNIFEVATGLDGKQYYVPLSAENWIACLETLRLSLTPDQ